MLLRIKLGRRGEPEDIMAAIVFLASDASALMTARSDAGWRLDG
jgi:NAD(P)-dependent dehydrogenase (short-subunit alcohol dehydrogenase family)